MIFFLKPYLSNNYIKHLTNVWLVVFVASNKPIVTCFGYQSLLKKLIPNANTSKAPLDIQRSKLTIAKEKFANVRITYCWFFFSINLGNISCENCLLEGKFNFGHKSKVKCFGHIFSTTELVNCSWQSKDPSFLKKFSMAHLLFLKESLIEKKLKIDPPKKHILFFVDCLYFLPFSKKFTSSSNIFTIIMCSASTCFFKEVIPFVLYIKN